MIISKNFETYRLAMIEANRKWNIYASSDLCIPVIIEHSLADKTIHIVALGGLPYYDILERYTYDNLSKQKTEDRYEP